MERGKVVDCTGTHTCVQYTITLVFFVPCVQLLVASSSQVRKMHVSAEVNSTGTAVPGKYKFYNTRRLPGTGYL